MEPLNITIEGLNLDTVIGGHYYGGDDDSGGSPKVLLDAIVEAATIRLVKDAEVRDIYGGLAKRVAKIRDEEIRERVRVELEEVMAQPVTATNQWGEAVGQPTTLRALIVAEATKFFTVKLAKDSYDRGQALTGAQRVVADLVKAELTKELAAAFAEEKAKVVKAVQGKAAELLAQAVKDGLR